LKRVIVVGYIVGMDLDLDLDLNWRRSHMNIWEEVRSKADVALEEEE